MVKIGFDMQLNKLEKYLDEYFAVYEFQADPSQNGLQVEANSKVTKIATAVDACMDTFKKAKKYGADLLLVHHGIFWNRSLKVKGVHGRRISFLIKNNISLYGMHLPLDVHKKTGNNAQLAKLLDLKVVSSFGNYKGFEIGLEVKTSKPVNLETMTKKITKLLGYKPTVLNFGNKKIHKIAIVTGGGSSEISEVARKNIDLFITGEGGHSAYNQIKDYGLNVIYAGHYATETVGIKALGEHLEQKFGLEHIFIDNPTGF